MQTYDPTEEPGKGGSDDMSAERGSVENAPHPPLTRELRSLLDLARIVTSVRPDNEYARGVLEVLQAAAGEFPVLTVAEELTEALNSDAG